MVGEILFVDTNVQGNVIAGNLPMRWMAPLLILSTLILAPGYRRPDTPTGSLFGIPAPLDPNRPSPNRTISRQVEKARLKVLDAWPRLSGSRRQVALRLRRFWTCLVISEPGRLLTQDSLTYHPTVHRMLTEARRICMGRRSDERGVGFLCQSRSAVMFGTPC